MKTPVIINSLNILALLGWEENEDMEFKSAKGGLPKSLWETYSAMANTHGGIILLGVEDSGIVSGVVDADKLKKAFWDTINNRGKVSANLLNNIDVAEIPYDGATILAIRVLKASRYQRPLYLNQNPLIGTYRRNHESDYRCTEQEVSRMLSDRSEESADSRILENFHLSDIDIASLQQYRQRLASHKPTHPSMRQILRVCCRAWLQKGRLFRKGRRVGAAIDYRGVRMTPYIRGMTPYIRGVTPYITGNLRLKKGVSLKQLPVQPGRISGYPLKTLSKSSKNSAKVVGYPEER